MLKLLVPKWQAACGTYISGLPTAPYSVVLMQVTPGVVAPVYSDREFDHVLKKHADQLVVVCASSTDCKPCRSFEPVFDVGAFVISYLSTTAFWCLSGYGLPDLAWGSYQATMWPLYSAAVPGFV